MELDERRLAQIWQAQWLTAGLRTTEGTPVEVVYRGVWTHRQGPDFAGSLLVIGHQLLEGDVELHLAASDWYAHGHHDDPAYDRVILHGVWRDDLGRPVQRRDGRSIPTLVLADYLPGELAAFPAEPIRSLGALGFTHCAPEIAQKEPQRLLRLFAEAGDERLRDKVRRVHARLTGEPPEQTLYWLLADALGYSKNREGMRALAEALPLIELEARLRAQKPDERFTTAAAWLFGLGGFLPASPRERALLPLPPDTWHALERLWLATGTGEPAVEIRWNLVAVRPTNHPLRRLASLAALVASADKGLLGVVVERVQAPRAQRALLDWLTTGPVPLGRGRALEVIVNVVIPFALAYAEWIDDTVLAGAALTLWEELPTPPSNAIVSATLEQICGQVPLPIGRAREQQGLLHLYFTGCRPRRCYECPIAHLVVRDREPNSTAE